VSEGFLVGLDVGGSRTRALVASPEGAALGLGEAGAGNHEVVGYDGLLAAMRAALDAALSAARDRGLGLSPARCLGAGFGVAGFDWESERKDTMRAIGGLGLGCPVELRNDGALGLAAGSSEGWGVGLSAGTSNNCYALARDGREWRLAGAGACVGENGGGLEIASMAIVAVNHARVGRTGPTALSGILCSLAGCADADELVEAVSTGRVTARSAWAPEVFAAARGGDAAARGIVDWAGRELGESAAAAARSLGFAGEPFELVLAGSLFDFEPGLREGIASVVARAAPGARLLRLEAPPVAGAAALAARAAGLGAALPGERGIRARLLASTRLLSA
jgi:N-acetylglucosamine kinase-like BadF-type ATPase